MTTENEPAPYAAPTGGIAPSNEIVEAASSTEMQARSRPARGVWLLATGFLGCIAICLYGMFWMRPQGTSALEFAMVMASVHLAQLSLMLLWSLLGDDRPVVRFGLLPAGLVILSFILLRSISDSYEIVIDLLKMVLLVSVPLLIMRRNGWQITRTAPAPTTESGMLRFSLADVLIGTTGLAMVLGLTAIDGIVVYDFSISLLFALPTLAATLLAFRGWISFFVLAVSGSTAGLYALLLLTRYDELGQLGLAISGTNAILAVLIGVQAATITAACGVLRIMGYRLRHVTRAHGVSAGA